MSVLGSHTKGFQSPAKKKSILFPGPLAEANELLKVALREEQNMQNLGRNIIDLGDRAPGQR